jgi:hypothetical protein
MTKRVLEILDPRDDFLFMLLERINALEQENIEMRMTLQKQNESFEVSNENMCSSKLMARAFVLRTSFTNDSLLTIDELKTHYESIVQLLLQKFGEETFRSISVVIETYSDVHGDVYHNSCVYMNMKNRCWIDKTTKMLSEIKFPIWVNIETDHLACAFNSHIALNLNQSGIIYNAYDVNGVIIAEPKWAEWTMYARILAISS